MKQTLSLLLVSFIFPLIMFSQTRQDTALANYSKFERALSFAGLIQTRYTVSTTKNVDVNGRNFTDSAGGITNSFSLKRVRFQVKARINDHFDAVILANFADFANSNTANRVLENAYIRYSLNNHFHVIAGQYRPSFGIEDAIPVDIIRSLDYSNQYTAFGNSGWQSFQVGVGVYGDINKADAEVPLRYFAGVHNGNNRNQLTDNDNTKHFYTRLETDLATLVTLGINGGVGSSQKQRGHAWGADLRSKLSFNKKWKLDLIGEYKYGTNFAAWNAFLTTPKPDIDLFRMGGFYFLPILRYEYKHPRVRAVEFSARYEYFDDSKEIASNPRQTITPMLSLVFADDYYVCLQLGMYIELYEKDIPRTTQYSHNQAVAQLQVRF